MNKPKKRVFLYYAANDDHGTILCVTAESYVDAEKKAKEWCKHEVIDICEPFTKHHFLQGQAAILVQ